MTDIGHLWYPYTQMKHMKAPFHVTGADGVYMHTDRGDLIDSTSSWWCMIYGYRNEEICRALREATDTVLGQVLYETSLKMKNGYSRADA